VRASAVGVSVTYQLGGTRNFKPAPAALIDVVRNAWYLRRADMATSTARDVLDELAARVPEALPRRFVGGLPTAEIAERMGLAEGTVRVHLSRGLRRLRLDLEATT